MSCITAPYYCEACEEPLNEDDINEIYPDPDGEPKNICPYCWFEVEVVDPDQHLNREGPEPEKRNDR